MRIITDLFPVPSTRVLAPGHPTTAKLARAYFPDIKDPSLTARAAALTEAAALVDEQTRDRAAEQDEAPYLRPQ